MRQGSSMVVTILLVISGTVARGNAPWDLPRMPMPGVGLVSNG